MTLSSYPPAPRDGSAQRLFEQGHLSAEHYHVFQQLHAHSPLSEQHLLLDLGFVSSEQLRASQLAQLPDISLLEHPPESSALALLTRDEVWQWQVLPLRWFADQAPPRLQLAISRPCDLLIQDQLCKRLSTDIVLEFFSISDQELLQALSSCYPTHTSVRQLLPLLASPQQAPIRELVDALLQEAGEQGASDIHLEPERAFLRVRYRIDGELEPAHMLPLEHWPAMVVRLKLLAQLDIAETRAPQDGQFSFSLHGRSLDIRLACQPTLHGENLVLRLLDRQRAILPLEALGLSARLQPLLQHILQRPEGMMLITGPTGSGKTTTLYALLNQLSHPGINIMTLEDPVEYPLALLRQTSISDAIKLTFANGIRSILRQDPDVILVGEIRDLETAQMALSAAMTGHQVFSTLHTPSALAAIPRLLDIGLSPSLLAGNLSGLMAQRLVRRLCPHCKQPYHPSRDELVALGLPASTEATTVLQQATGCALCRHTGYRGRLVIAELIALDDDFDELIARSAPLNQFRQLARCKGYPTLLADAQAHVIAGETTLAEIARIVRLPSASQTTEAER